MGHAAYARGNHLISEQIQREQEKTHPVEFELMDRWNAIPKDPDAQTPWGDATLTAANGGLVDFLRDYGLRLPL
jgi:hypothetical protein